MAISEYLRNLRTKIGHDLVFMPGVAGIVFNDENQILLQRSRDSGLWGIIGGSPEPGETPADSIVREIEEETNVKAVVQHLVGVFTEVPTHYPNHDMVQYVAIVFVCKAISGEPLINDDESLAVGYFDPNEMPDDLLARHRNYIDLAVRNRPYSYFIFDGKLNRER